jgi:hypothetical protein
MYALHPVSLCASHPPNLQALSEGKKRPTASQKQRRHSNTEIRPWLRHNDSRSRVMFKRAATTTRVITRLRMLSANKSNSGKVAPTPRPRCGSSFCAYELLSSPLVVRSLFPVVELFIDWSLYWCRSPCRHALTMSARLRTPEEKGKE